MKDGTYIAKPIHTNEWGLYTHHWLMSRPILNTAGLKYDLPVDILHDVSGPGQLDLQLTSMFHEEIHQCPRHRG